MRVLQSKPRCGPSANDIHFVEADGDSIEIGDMFPLFFITTGHYAHETAVKPWTHGGDCFWNHKTLDHVDIMMKL